MEEGIGQTISCAAHGCDILVDDQTVMRLITDQKVCTCKMPKLSKTLILVSEAGGTLVNNIIIGRTEALWKHFLRYKEKEGNRLFGFHDCP